MARKAKLEPKKTDSGWMLNIPAKLSNSGKRERHFFKTRAEAKTAADKLKSERDEFGHQALAISPSLAEQAHKAASMLEPFGVTIIEAAQAYVSREEARLASKTIEEAVAAFQHDRATIPRKGKTIGERQAKNYRLRAEKFSEAFSGRLVAEITGEEIEEHLLATTDGPSAFDQQLRLTRTLWGWFARPKQGWANLSVLDDIEAQGDGEGEIEVLTAKEAQALMSAAIEHKPETVPAFAIALFTGMRQAEIARLVPSDITEDGITVPALSSKTKRRRFVHMNEPLQEWLEAYPIGETVCPPDWSRKYRLIRRKAGFRVWSDLVKPNEPPKKLPKWRTNALRHTAATMNVNMGKPIEILVFEHGHTGGLEMLRRHYVGAMTKREALKIYGIRPSKTKAKRKESVA